jgi:hypothetical protein
MNFDFMGQALTQQILDDVISQGIMTLGELIATLSALTNIDADKEVFLNDTLTSVDCFDSYRGYYNHLAIEPTTATVTVYNLLTRARNALNTTFTGYKGGDYRMSKITPIWVAEYGDASGQGLVEIEHHEDRVILRTKVID